MADETLGARQNKNARPVGPGEIFTHNESESPRPALSQLFVRPYSRCAPPYCGGVAGVAGAAGVSFARVSVISIPGKSAESDFVDILIVSPSTVQSW